MSKDAVLGLARRHAEGGSQQSFDITSAGRSTSLLHFYPNFVTDHAVGYDTGVNREQFSRKVSLVKESERSSVNANQVDA